jgi:hypothetical protein
MSNKQGKRSDTSPGLGPGAVSLEDVRQAVPSTPVAPAAPVAPVAPVASSTQMPSGSSVPVRRRLRDSIRREDIEDEDGEGAPSLAPASLGSRPAGPFVQETPTGTRRKSGREAVTVDEVGEAAVRMAKGARLEQTPRILASRELIAMAPIDARSAFVLALVDGRNTVEAILDMSGMPADEARAILEKLTLLRLIEVR